MKEAKSLQEIYKPEYQRILDDETKFTIKDVFDAKRKLKIEQNEADRKGITIEDLRLQKQVARQEVGKKIKEQEEWLNSIKNVDLKTFGNTCFHFMIESCKSNGSEFKTDCQKTMDMYREIIRYFYWNGNCEILDKSRFLFLFGSYGSGKSMCVKSILKAMQYHRHNNWSYFHLPTVTKNYMAQSVNKDIRNDAFESLFSCSKNMVIDEIGDKSEKQKFYGNEIESVRSLILDKYDKWISNSANPNSQKIVFTSNLFPDKEYFFTESENDIRPTIRNFYDEKVYNKMGEMCNLVRFPNVSYRTKNKVELL